MLKVSSRGDSHRNPTEREDDDAAVSYALPRFGVALFDDSRDSGWAMLPDGEPFRFRTPEDLRNDCIWVCSAESSEFRTRWSKQHHLRANDYISKLSHITADFGFRADGQGKFGALAKSACTVLAPTIHRAMVIASQAYGWRHPAQMLREDTLTDDLQKYLARVVAAPAVRNDMRMPIASAYQTYSSPPWPAPKSGKTVALTLRYNRLVYAQKVMATPMPDTSWIHNSVDLTPNFRYPMEQALDPDQPCLVCATVEFAGKERDLATLCAFGSQIKRTVLRTWISQPELRWLSRFAHVQITGVIYTQSVHPLPKKLQLPEMLTGDPLFELSVPAGLVAEAHWKALAKDLYKPNVEGKKEISQWALWLRATDRALSFELALAAHRRGFEVLGYGNGSATVKCEQSQLPQLLDFTLENDVAHPCFEPIFKEYGLIT